MRVVRTDIDEALVYRKSGENMSWDGDRSLDVAAKLGGLGGVRASDARQVVPSCEEGVTFLYRYILLLP